MDGILNDGRKGRLWLCQGKKGHALGILVRAKVEDRFVQQLLLFRESVQIGEADRDAKAILLKSTKTLGFVEGTMHDIECDHCDAKRTWWSGQAAIDLLLERRKERLVRALLT